MTDQRNRVTTDPGLGPVQREHASTLRSITAADPIPEEEIPGNSVYFEPKPLHAVSEHKTLELETVKLASDIDPRKLPTEVKLRRPVLHVLPASDPNWPKPMPLEFGPFHDSNWPPPETTHTTSQFPAASRRRTFVPFVLLLLVGATLLLLLSARARHRSRAPAVAVQAALPVPAAAALSVRHAAAPALSTEASPSPRAPAVESATPPPSVNSAQNREALPVASPAIADAASASAPLGSASVASPLPEPSAAAARFADQPHHVPSKASPPGPATSSALSETPAAKPKRAIY